MSSYNFLGAAQAGHATSATTPSMDTSGATLIALCINYPSTSSLTVSDSKGNTWTGLTASVFSGGVSSKIYYCLNPATDSAHTFTVAGTTVGVIALAFANIQSFDQVSALSPSGANTNAQLPSITPAKDGALIIVSFTEDAGVGFADMRQYDVSVADPSFGTVLSQLYLENVASTNNAGSVLWGFQGSKTAIAPKITWGASATYAGTIASFNITPANSNKGAKNKKGGGGGSGFGGISILGSETIEWGSVNILGGN